MTQLTLFELPEPPERCSTCGTPAPAGHLEPVSRECLGCNHRTVEEILHEYLATRGRPVRSPIGRAALSRHYGGDERLPRLARDRGCPDWPV